MSDRQSARQVDDEAADWATRADGRDHDSAFQSDLQAWLAGDRRREGAFLRAQAALSFLDRGRALAGAEPLSAVRRPAATRRGLLTAGAAGASIAAGVGGLAFFASGGRRYDTALGEIRRVPLEDGSLMALNTTTAVEVSLHPKLRQVRLQQGEAWFEVAKDAARPFVVEAGALSVRAVGTAFSVRRQQTGVDVLVTEGVVEYWLEDARTQRVSMGVGSRLALSDGRLSLLVETPTQIDGELAWRAGQIVLDGQSLAEAAHEFNRYNQRQIVIDDPSLAAEQFVGRFRTNEPESFAAAVSATTGALVSADAASIRLSRGGKS